MTEDRGSWGSDDSSVVRPRPFIAISTDHGVMIANHLDYCRLPDGRTFGVGSQLLWNGQYDIHEVSKIRSLLNSVRASRGSGVVALDCGANIGVITVEMARFMTDWGTVLAFEAQERLYYALCGNIALNNLFNARANFCALDRASGTLDIPVPKYTSPASFGSLELLRQSRTEYIGQTISYSSKDTVSVPALALDDLYLPRVDFIKLDVEGMELRVLEGAKELIIKHHPILLAEWIKSNKKILQEFGLSLGYNCIQELGGSLLFSLEPKEPDLWHNS